MANVHYRLLGALQPPQYAPAGATGCCGLSSRGASSATAGRSGWGTASTGVPSRGVPPELPPVGVLGRRAGKLLCRSGSACRRPEDNAFYKHLCMLASQVKPGRIAAILYKTRAGPPRSQLSFVGTVMLWSTSAYLN